MNYLEEDELGRVCGCSAVETGELLDNDVRMANDLTALELLGSGDRRLIVEGCRRIAWDM